MSEFSVRKAIRADCAAIASMWREQMTLHAALDPRFQIAEDGERKYARHVMEMLRSRDALALVAETYETAEPIGFVLGEIQNRPPKIAAGLYGLISDLYVREAWRRHGVGRGLYEEVRRWCLARNVNAIELYAAEYNPEALAFWESMGMMPFLKLLHVDLHMPDEGCV